MSEDEFRSTYHTVNPQRCCFEKTLLARRAECHLAQRLNIGEREGVACSKSTAQQRCCRLLELLRHKAIFSLGLTRLDGPLPHAKEVKVQTGGLLGLQQLLNPDAESVGMIDDIDQLLEHATATHPDLDTLPYETLARTIVKFEGRPKKNNNRNIVRGFQGLTCQS